MCCSLVVCAGATAATQTAFAFVVMEDGRNANTWTAVVILLRCVVDILSSVGESSIPSTGSRERLHRVVSGTTTGQSKFVANSVLAIIVIDCGWCHCLRALGHPYTMPRCCWILRSLSVWNRTKMGRPPRCLSIAE